MKVYIGNYPDRLICRVYDRHIEKKYGKKTWELLEEETDVEDERIERLESFIQDFYNLTINKILDLRKRKIKVRIDEQDTWSMDTTLSHIILPMLKQLKESKHGSPHVDPEDVPENLRESDVHAQWDWVMDEMIWAFEQVKNDNLWEISDMDKQEELQARKQNGLLLFGKYYEGLWD